MLPKGHAVTDITAEALRQSAVTMTTQIELLAEPEEVVVPTLDKAFQTAVRSAVKEKETH
jgi:hypothetical protein